MAREILAIRGLERTSPEFRRELVRVADRRGLDPSFLAAVMSFETGGKFDPTVENPLSHCIGLIQFCNPAGVGTTHDALARMSPTEQLAYVERHYEKVDPNRRVKSLEDHYLAVFSPACIGYPPNAVLPCVRTLAKWQRPEGGCPLPLRGPYCQNRGLDFDNDGVITAHEATTPVRQLVNQASARPPIVVDDASAGPDVPGPQSPWLGSHAASRGAVATLLPFAAAAIIGYYGYSYVSDRSRHLYR